jgi:hypothetical protein
MTSMRWSCVVAAVALVGCASAGKDKFGNGRPDSGITLLDSSGGGGQKDAPLPMIDAPAGQVTVTLQETTNNTIVAGNSVACGACNNLSSPCNSAYTAEDAYYRVFALSDFGITNTFHVSQVTFGVQESSGTQTVQVKIGTYAGTPGTTLNTGATDFAGSVTPVNSATIDVPATTTGVSVPAPISGDIPAGSNVIVEVFSPTHMGQANVYFYLGASNAGETKSGYLRSPSCGAANPATSGSLGFPAANFLISITGTH